MHIRLMQMALAWLVLAGVTRADISPQAHAAVAADSGAVAPSSHPSRALNISCLRAMKKPVGWPMAASPTLWRRDFMTGDWGGERSRWWDNGFEVVAAYLSNFFSSVSGGQKTGSAYFGVGIASVDLHTDGLGLWKGGMIHLTASALHGQSIAYEYVGALNPAYYYDYANVDGLRLYELFYEQKFGGGEFAVRAGQIYPYVLFGACGSACGLLNGSFHYPTYIGSALDGELGRGLGPAFISALPGVQLRLNPNPRWAFMAQVQDGYGDPSGGFGVDNKHGLTPKLGSGEGAEILLQASWRRTQGLPGTYTAGVQLHTGEFADKYEPLEKHRGDQLAYFIAEQMLWRRHAEQSITGFGKIALAPAQANTVSLNTAWGLSWKGLLPGRGRDALACGVSHSRISAELRKFQRENGLPEATAETVAEVAYSALLAPWLLVHPTVQWIRRPGGSGAVEDAVVVGVSSGISF